MRGSRWWWVWALGWFGVSVLGMWFALSTFDSSAPAVAGVVVAVVGAAGFGAATGFWRSLLYPVAWASLALVTGLASPTYRCSWDMSGPATNRAGSVVSPQAALGTAGAGRCADGTLPDRTSPLDTRAWLAVIYGAPLALASGAIVSLRRRRRAPVGAQGYSSSSGSP